MPPTRAAGTRKLAPAQQSRTVDEDFVMQDEGHGDGYGDLREKERKMKNNMAVDVRARKGERQRRLEEAFDDQVRDLEGQIDERVEEYEQETLAILTRDEDRKRIQDDFVTRLLALAQKKAEIEKRIVQHVQELAEAYDVVKGEFQAVLKGRSEDVRDATNALCGLQEESNARSEDRS
ncbi:hypothetical protein H2200_009355 [Cladophialophora chaetospira]|uniref:Uncharacterized protein n=1 Tax=Cladophialophora chaetospira TaxID=386627 RepID=A0AA38X3Y3_9EURO|nr:hypothetical protein H2200_009355 [Cladophialophora chaetospira]